LRIGAEQAIAFGDVARIGPQRSTVNSSRPLTNRSQSLL
jgi:hypothetical protein